MKRFVPILVLALSACGDCSGSGTDCPPGAACESNNANNKNNANNEADLGQIDDGGTAEEDVGERIVDPHPNLIPTEDLFMCEGTQQSSPGRIRRIARLEWTRNIGQREIDNASLNPLRPDPSHLYSTWSVDESLDPVVLDQFLGFVGTSANDWISNGGKPNGLGCMVNPAALPDRVCIDAWVAFYLRYVLFRPATPEEIERLATFAETTVQQIDNEGRPRADAIQKITSAAWLTTSALFRSEMGTGADIDGTDRELSEWETAQSLALALSDFASGAPDYTSGSSLSGDMLSDIHNAATAGTVRDPAVIDSVVRAYYGGLDPTRADVELDVRWSSRRGQYWLNHKVQRFFQEWLGYQDVETIFKDRPAATSIVAGAENVNLAYGQLLNGFYGYESTIDQQLDDMIARIVVEDQDVFNRLMTSRRFYIGSNLSDGFKATEKIHYIYNYTQDIADNRAARWIDLPPTEHAGVLTHPAWLAAHGGNFDNDPSIVVRGKWIRENMLCGLVPDVPITVDASFPDSTIELSARQRLEMSVGADNFCAGCHSLMDPLGLPFEIYNHAGYLRRGDHGSAVNGSSTLVATGASALDVDVQDAIELAELLGSSEFAKRCFIRQVFRYFMGRAETLADACTLTEMENAYDGSNGSLVTMLVTLMQSETFLNRHTPVEEVAP